MSRDKKLKISGLGKSMKEAISLTATNMNNMFKSSSQQKIEPEKSVSQIEHTPIKDDTTHYNSREIEENATPKSFDIDTKFDSKTYSTDMVALNKVADRINQQYKNYNENSAFYSENDQYVIIAKINRNGYLVMRQDAYIKVISKPEAAELIRCGALLNVEVVNTSNGYTISGIHGFRLRDLDTFVLSDMEKLSKLINPKVDRLSRLLNS